ncbi:MAG: prepilin peptidase [Candidatus Binatia bacterium]
MALGIVLQTHPAFFLAFITLLGLIVGSFLNVVIHRLPVMLERAWRRECRDFLELEGNAEEQPPYNLVTPQSRCPACGHRIRAWENIPLVSYMIQRGRCAACKTAIPVRYPLVEALTGVLSLLVAWRFGCGWETAGALLLTWALIALAVIDLRTQLLPDAMTLPFVWLGLLMNVAGLFTDLQSAVLGAVFGYLSLWLVYQAFKLLTGREGMGHGDFKLLALLGAWMGWQMLPLIILLSSVTGAVIGIALILMKGRDKNIPIPFGPYLAIAGWIALLWGDVIIDLYVGTF